MEDNGDLDMQLLALNGLSYAPPSELSLASAHRLRSFPALRASYQGGTSGYCDVTVGSDQIATNNSFLEFKITATSANGSACTLPTLGALSVFRETIVRDRAGAELDRSQHHNVFMNDQLKTTTANGTMATKGSAMGPGATLTSGVAQTVCIPLAWINPMFSSQKLLPTSVIGSLRIEFILANAVEAILCNAATTCTYEVSDMNFWIDTYSLADSALRSLQMIASNSGLAYSWVSSHATVNTSDGTYANFVSLKSASRALCASLHIAESDEIVKVDVDGLLSETWDVTSSQWSLGSMYMPVRRLDSAQSHYYNTLYSQDAFGHDSEFACELTYAQWLANYGTVNTTLERSGVLDAQGSATSSSRPLICDINWANSVDRTTILFLQYQKVALAFSNGSTVVKE